MKRLLLFFTSVLLLSGCNKSVIYKEYHTFENYTWPRFEKIRFTIPVETAGTTADIVFTLRHITQYPYPDLPVNIVMTTPSGEERVLEKDIRLTDDKGEFTGDVAGDLWDYETPLWPSFYFADKGNYTVEIEVIIPKVEIPGLVDVGLYVNKK